MLVRHWQSDYRSTVSWLMVQILSSDSLMSSEALRVANIQLHNCSNQSFLLPQTHWRMSQMNTVSEHPVQSCEALERCFVIYFIFSFTLVFKDICMTGTVWMLCWQGATSKPTIWAPPLRPNCEYPMPLTAVVRTDPWSTALHMVLLHSSAFKVLVWISTTTRQWAVIS